MVNNMNKMQYIYIIETYNNIFVNLLDEKHKLIIQFSGGNLGMKGSKKQTPLVGELLGKKIGKELVNRQFFNIAIKVKGSFSSIIRSFFRGVLLYKIKIMYIEEIKGISHNGVRKKKQRRL